MTEHHKLLTCDNNGGITLRISPNGGAWPLDADGKWDFSSYEEIRLTEQEAQELDETGRMPDAVHKRIRERSNELWSQSHRGDS